MFYCIIFLILVFFAVVETTSTESLYKEIFFLLGIMILWFVAAFRFETGGDWTTYTAFSEEVESLGEVAFGDSPVFTMSYMEPGYKLINSFAKTFGGGVQVVFFIMATMNAFLLYFSLKKYLTKPILGLILYFGSLYFVLDFVALRQCFAVLLFFFSIEYIHKRNFLKYLLLILIASLFHKSSLVLLPLYFILGRPLSKSTYIIVFVLCIAIYALQIHWIKPIILIIAKSIGGNTSLIIENYVTSPIYGVSRLISVGVFINVILFIIYLINFERLSKIKYFYFFFNLFILNVFLYFVCYELIEVGNRYRYYFILSNLILLPSLTTIFNIRFYNILAFLFCILFSLFYIRNILFELPSGVAYNPYQNYILHRFLNLESDGKERLEMSDKEHLKGREN